MLAGTWRNYSGKNWDAAHPRNKLDGEGFSWGYPGQEMILNAGVHWHPCVFAPTIHGPMLLGPFWWLLLKLQNDVSSFRVPKQDVWKYCKWWDPYTFISWYCTSPDYLWQHSFHSVNFKDPNLKRGSEFPSDWTQPKFTRILGIKLVGSINFTHLLGATLSLFHPIGWLKQQQLLVNYNNSLFNKLETSSRQTKIGKSTNIHPQGCPCFCCTFGGPKTWIQTSFQSNAKGMQLWPCCWPRMLPPAGLIFQARYDMDNDRNRVSWVKL